MQSSSASANSHLDISSFSSIDENEISILSSSSISTAVTTSSYTSNQLQRLLQKEKKKFRILNNESTKPLVSWWRSFGYPAVLNEKDELERIPGYISCLKCCHTLIYGPASGTKRFISHADQCFPLASSCSSGDKVDDPQSTQLKLDQIGFTRKAKLPEKEQNELKHLYANWVCGDLRPYSVVEDKGFEQLAQMFIKIGENSISDFHKYPLYFTFPGSQYGVVDVKDVLRSRQTVSRTVNELALKYRLDLKDQLIEPLKSKSVTISPDFWTNKYTQQSFLGVNITFTNHEYGFKSIDLFCIPFNGMKSYDLILETLRRHLSEYGIGDLADVNIISDRGSNFVKAFAIYNPIYCFGHRLNNILKICFFQQQKKKKDKHDELSTTNTTSINSATTINSAITINSATTINSTTNVVPVLQYENSSSDSESESSDLEEENYELNVLNEDTLVKFQKKKKVYTYTATGQIMSVKDIPHEAKKIILLLKKTKELVKYVKLTSLNQEIKAAGGTTLHQACIVRWLSLSHLLESVIKSFKITKKLLYGKQKQHMIHDLDEQYLKQLVLLLKPFKHMMTILQRGNSPSLHLVSLCYMTLKEILNSYESLKKYNKEHSDQFGENQNSENLYDDDDLEHELQGITWFRERLLLLLKEMFVLDIRHIVATLLHPLYRSLKKFPDYIKNQCHQYIRRQIRLLKAEAETEEQLRQPLEPSKKKLKGDKNIFSRFESGNCDEEIMKNNKSGSESDEYDFNIKKGDELDRYLLLEFDKNKQYTEPLQFWKDYQNQFPFLSKYARSIFSIPATTTNVEREFSTAGYVLNQRRSSLKPEEVDKILFIRSMEKQLEKD
ncbi:unnamed protein product [Rotaria sp. Silwood2]|nr:unnamed protein product [Rotaria sp. Silwood2]CAF2945858.1 unnamed protein product [Rotaria sp. Silwood2]CAF3372729.1 unnamed protein product [Rotaria sp. Silwood2]CAF4136120.1 unnamed protein product [Rotaria sp. Silwood2]CAF4142787.1 unnamed protein product [Rotaria sp. Silwood2]